jgi:hypothetical protein
MKEGAFCRTLGCHKTMQNPMKINWLAFEVYQADV